MNKQAGKRSECAYHTLFESIVQMHFLQNGERERPVGGSLTLPVLCFCSTANAPAERVHPTHSVY